MALARIAAERAHQVRFQDVPADVVETVTKLFLDQLGVGLASAALRNGTLMRALEYDGTHAATREAALDDVRGSPRRPLSRSEIHMKFRESAGRVIAAGAVERVFEAVQGLDRTAELAALTAALRRFR